MNYFLDSRKTENQIINVQDHHKLCQSDKWLISGKIKSQQQKMLRPQTNFKGFSHKIDPKCYTYSESFVHEAHYSIYKILFGGML